MLSPNWYQQFLLIPIWNLWYLPGNDTHQAYKAITDIIRANDEQLHFEE